MKTLPVLLSGCVLMGNALALDSASRITPAMQAILDAQKAVIAQWAANPVIIGAVKAQNARGPLPGMTNSQWKSLPPDDPRVQSLAQNAAGKWLAGKTAASRGLVIEAFLSGAQGEKAAFAAKPTSYLHTKEDKFDIPMTGRPWEGKPEFDKSTRDHSIQIATPVLSGKKPIGVLVVGYSMRALKAASQEAGHKR